DPPALAITEIHFNPDGDDATEFVELQNLGATAIDLSGIHFSSGLKFTFTSGTLAPGERLVLVRDATAFSDAYPDVTIGGVFEDGALDNGGEQLVLSEVGGRMIVEADYNDWLDAADGGGFSLVLVPGADASIKSSWVSEYVSGGTPGAATITAFSADPGADLDGDGLSDLLEYALATDPLVATPSPWVFGADRISIDWNIAAHDIDFMVEVSTDGRNWSEAAGEVTLLGDGRANTMLLVGDGLLLVRARCQLR
ncbi:MAG: lamin tail domain-containing protein, partial [Akkermansiaceae bacterium]